MQENSVEFHSQLDESLDKTMKEWLDIEAAKDSLIRLFGPYA